jgi:DNA-binding MarR family transcriptional regulator
VKIEDELQTNKFRSEQHKAALNVLFTAYKLHTVVVQVLKPFGLTAEQYNVMRILKGSAPKPLCVKEIAERLIERSSNVPRILDRLQAKEYITRTRSENDGRETLIELTQAAVKLTEIEARLLNDLLDKSREN